MNFSLSSAITTLLLMPSLNFASSSFLYSFFYGFFICLVLFSQHPVCLPLLHHPSRPSSLLLSFPTCSFTWFSPNSSVFINSKMALIKTDGQIILSRAHWNAHKLFQGNLQYCLWESFPSLFQIFTRTLLLCVGYILPLNGDGEISLAWNVKISVIRVKYLLHRRKLKRFQEICAVHLRPSSSLEARGEPKVNPHPQTSELKKRNQAFAIHDVITHFQQLLFCQVFSGTHIPALSCW